MLLTKADYITLLNRSNEKQFLTTLIADKIATRTGDFGVSSVIKKSPPVSNNIFET